MRTGSFEAFDVAVRRRRHGPSASFIDLLAGLRRVERIAHLRADERGIFLDGAYAVARDDVRHAYLLPRDREAPVVVFETVSQTIEVYVSSAAKGEALLAATRLTVKDATVRYENVGLDGAPKPRVAVVGGMLALCVGGAALVNVSGVSASFWVPLALGACVVAAINAAHTTDVTIGADGIACRTASHEEFFPHSSIVIEPGGDIASTNVRLRAGARRLSLQFGTVRARTSFVTRLTAAREQSRHCHAPSDAAARLARGARDSGEWLRALRALVQDAPASYRSSSIPVDDLWQVVEDPAAPSSARAGAALGLHATLDESGRSRLRIAAEACASPRLRVTLEAAASVSDDETLERAVEHCADDALEASTEASAAAQRG